MSHVDNSPEMLHLFINALAASAGGGLTYIRNVLPSLAARNDVRVTLAARGALRDEISSAGQIITVKNDQPASSVSRLWYEQCALPQVIRHSGAHVLLSTGNFAIFGSPVPQILLSRNALYTSNDFRRDLRERGDYRLWLDTEVKAALARWSIRTADCTVAPSAAFACELRQWTGKDVLCIHHGFAEATFFRDQSPLPQGLQAQLDSTAGSLRLLFVSHYNYYRNFGTLIRAIAILKKKLHPRAVRLILTCKLNSKDNPGSYRAEAAAALVQALGLKDEVVELGAVPYAMLHHLYRACDFYVTPAYAETFAHPLVEAMASGLPVIASDLAVHREICRDSALYFPRFSADSLAERVLQVAQSAEKADSLRAIGLLRSRDFSWDKHVEDLLTLARCLARHSPESR